MGDVVYWIHKYKLNEGVTEEKFEKYAQEKTMPKWLELTPCKQILLLKAVELPWDPNKSEEFDYLSVSVWDKEEHRKFCESGGFSKPEVQAYINNEAMQSIVGRLVGSFGSIELVAHVKREK